MMRVKRSFVLWIGVVVLLGCGESGDQRLNLSGTITYDGRPIPVGEIRFEPNISAGGKGPVGYATIIDSEYSTSDSGKGPLAGPVRISVTGFVSQEAFAPPLFPQYRTEATFESGLGRFDLVVPRVKRQ